MTNEMQDKKRRRQVRNAVEKMTPKQLLVCGQLKIPPQDYIIVMNKIHI